MAAQTKTSISTVALPILAIAFVLLALSVGFDGKQPMSPMSVTLSAAMLIIMLGAIFAAVHHADVIANRLGEPYGTLVLTLAVTVIEVALIESIVLTPGSSPTLARDTVFAVIMIVCNGLVGLCILVGGLRHHEQEFQVSGANVYLNVLAALSVLSAADGSRYANLNTALLYRTRTVNNCTCNGRDAFGVARLDVAGDPTLRAGDIVAIDGGFAAYTGSKSTARQNAAFTPIGQYSGVSSDTRRKLSETKVLPARQAAAAPAIEIGRAHV